MTCEVCGWIENKRNLLFETANCAVMLAPEPMVAGHMVVVPKGHAPIIESVSDEVLGEMFVLANKASMCVFEGLQAGGTNVLVQNGVPAGQNVSHTMVHVIPRGEDDGLSLTWQPTQADAGMLENIERLFKEQPKEAGRSKSDYIHKSLRRIP